ncbi:hypothetical protein OKW21_005952 [Catalinimonas alkaloidigena]|nr:hypothetical protein [Catalinimonas alkaloidigena]
MYNILHSRARFLFTDNLNLSVEFMKDYVIRGALSLLLILPWSCNTDDCGDLGGTQYYQITDITLANVRLIEGGYSIEENIPAQTAIAYNRYGLNLMPLSEESDQPSQNLTAGFFPAAYACSPVSPQPTEEIADIAVFSDADYVQAGSSKVIAAGDTLNSIFKIYDFYSGRIVGLTDFLIDDGLLASNDPIILQPASEPEYAQKHAFTVHYRLTNGEFYSMTAQTVTLTP